VLRAADYEVVVVSDGPEALQVVEQQPPFDIYVIDVVMPQMMVASGDRATATVIHTDVCEQHVIDDRTVHRRVRNLVRKTVELTTDDLMRTDPRGFPSWPEAVIASLRGRIHWRGRFLIDEGSLRIRGGPYILAEDRRSMFVGVNSKRAHQVRPPSESLCWHVGRWAFAERGTDRTDERLCANPAQPALICFPHAQVQLKHPRCLNHEFTIGHYGKRRQVAEDDPLL
jgi:hypothetical protein